QNLGVALIILEADARLTWLHPVNSGAGHEEVHQAKLEANEDKQIARNAQQLQDHRTQRLCRDELKRAGNDVDRHPKHEHDDDRPPDEARQLPVPAMEECVDLLVDLAIELVAIAIVGWWPIWFERHGRSPFLFYVCRLEHSNVRLLLAVVIARAKACQRRVGPYDLAVMVGLKDDRKTRALILERQVDRVEVHAAGVELDAADIVVVDELQAGAALAAGLGLKRGLGGAVRELVGLIVGTVGIPHHIGVEVLLALDIGLDRGGRGKRLGALECDRRGLGRPEQVAHPADYAKQTENNPNERGIRAQRPPKQRHAVQQPPKQQPIHSPEAQPAASFDRRWRIVWCLRRRIDRLIGNRRGYSLLRFAS